MEDFCNEGCLLSHFFPVLLGTEYIFLQACLAVVQYVGSMVERIRDSLDGKNVEALMMEFGARFHRVIYEHLQQFQYNSAGESKFQQFKWK